MVILVAINASRSLIDTPIQSDTPADTPWISIFNIDKRETVPKFKDTPILLDVNVLGIIPSIVYLQQLHQTKKLNRWLLQNDQRDQLQ